MNDILISAAVAVIVSVVGVLASHFIYTKVWIATTTEKIKMLEKTINDHSDTIKGYSSTITKIEVLEEKLNHLTTSVDRLANSMDKLNDKLDKISNK